MQLIKTKQNSIASGYITLEIGHEVWGAQQKKSRIDEYVITRHQVGKSLTPTVILRTISSCPTELCVFRHTTTGNRNNTLFY